MIRTIIVHPDMGIYLGSCMGMGFFSLLDAVGQDRAVVFLDEPQARDHVAHRENNNDPDAYQYKQVNVKDDYYADPNELLSAGLPEMFVLPLMTPEGHA